MFSHTKLAWGCCALALLFVHKTANAKDPKLPDDPVSQEASKLLPAVRGATDNLPGALGVISRLTGGDVGSADEDRPRLFEPLLEAESDVEPAELIQMRISHDFLQGFLEREVDRQSQVRETILGTSISGTAHTKGETELILRPSEENAVIEVILRGKVNAQTIGANGPVRLHCTSEAPFESHKLIRLTTDGIESSPATTEAHTRSTTRNITSTLPGLRGRIAQRIAERRSSELRGQADAIASRNTERRLNAEFDETVGRALTAARSAVQDKIVTLPVPKTDSGWHYRSQPEFVEMLLANPNAAEDATAAAWGEYDPEATFAIRVHRTAIRSALTNPELQQVVRPLMASLLVADAKPQGPIENVSVENVVEKVDQKVPSLHVAWSTDREWLEIHFAPVDDTAPKLKQLAKPILEKVAGEALAD